MQTYSIAEFVIRLQLEAGPVQRAIEDAWKEFRTSEAPHVTIEVAFLKSSGQMPPLQRAMPRVEILRDNSLIVHGEDFSGSIDRARTSAQVTQPADQRFPVEAFAKLLLAEHLMNQGGLLIHSVGLDHRGRGAIFTGHSGAGKTTLAGLSKQAGLDVLSDELVAVKRAGDEYFAFGTPWNVGFQRKAKLERVGILAFEREARIEPLQPSDLLRVLLPNVLMADSSSEGRARCFRGASELARTVPCLRLCFPQSPSVADAIRRELGRTPGRNPGDAGRR